MHARQQVGGPSGSTLPLNPSEAPPDAAQSKQSSAVWRPLPLVLSEVSPPAKSASADCRDEQQERTKAVTL